MAFNPVDPRTWGGGVRAVGRAAMAVNPFDPRNTNRAGEALGNFISRSKRAEGIVNAVGNRGGSAVAGAVRDLTGVGGFQRGATKAQQGDIRGALRETGLGAANLALSASGLGAAGKAYQVSRAAGRAVVPSAARATVSGLLYDPLGSKLGAMARNRGKLAKAGTLGVSIVSPLDAFSRRTTEQMARDYFGGNKATSRTGGASTSGRTADQWERILGGGGTPATAKPPYWDAEGRYHVYNPRTGLYEVTRLRDAETPTTPGGDGTPATEPTPAVPAAGGAFTVPGEDLGSGMFGAMPYEEGTTMSGPSRGAGGAGGYSEELAALSPEEMQELLEASRDAQRQYDEIINQIGRTTAETERDFFDYTRGVNRQVAGGRQNVASQLAQLGMDTSPAPQAYADYLGAQGQRQIAGGRAKVADILADLRGQRGTAESNKLRRLRELDMAMRNARARRTVNRVQY